MVYEKVLSILDGICTQVRKLFGDRDKCDEGSRGGPALEQAVCVWSLGEGRGSISRGKEVK